MGHSLYVFWIVYSHILLLYVIRLQANHIGDSYVTLNNITDLNIGDVPFKIVDTPNMLREQNDTYYYIIISVFQCIETHKYQPLDVNPPRINNHNTAKFITNIYNISFEYEGVIGILNTELANVYSSYTLFNFTEISDLSECFYYSIENKNSTQSICTSKLCIE